MDDWRTRFPSAAAANWVAQWAVERTDEIKAGKDDDALDKLRRDSWRTTFDFTGVPGQAMQDMQASATEAQLALARGDKDSAIAALTKLVIYAHPQV